MLTSRCSAPEFGLGGVRPSLTREQLRKLHVALQEVLREAIALGGSSVSDYVDADGEEGFFQLQHRVYGREGEPCLVCGDADQAGGHRWAKQSLLFSLSKVVGTGQTVVEQLVC